MNFIRSIFSFVYAVGDWVFRRFEGLGRVIYVGRVSIVVVVAMLLLLGLMPQGREIGFAVVDRPFMFFLPVMFCTLVCWLWVRVLLNQEFGPVLENESYVPDTDVPIENLRRWVRWVPRFVGIIPAIGALLSVYFAWTSSGGIEVGIEYVLYAVAVVFVLFAIVWFRRGLASYLARKAGPNLALLMKPKSDHARRFSEMSQAMRWSVTIAVLVPLIVVLPGLFMPARVGQLFGPTASVFAPAALLVSMLSVAIFMLHPDRQPGRTDPGSGRRFEFPVILVAALLSLVFTYFFDGDRFDLQISENGRKPQSRPELQDAIGKWIEQATLNLEGDDKADMVVVATAGGALRAAIWTGSILGVLQDRVPEFEAKLGAVSAVSGGALGAIAYRAALWEKQSGASGYDCDPEMDCFARRIQQGLSGDFLAPAMLGLISNDIALTFLGPVTKDRAEALEGAWELSWQDSAPELPGGSTIANAIAGNFLDMWDTDSENAQPALFLNGTRQEVGNRIITSNLRIDGRFVDAVDFFTLHPESIPTSTAAHNSARFPYISPTGEIEENYHIADGGYFENYGAETALEFVQLVKQSDTKGKIRVHVLQIISDPTLDSATVLKPDTCDRRELDRGTGSMPLGQYTAPIQGIMKTREARGIHAAVRLNIYASLNSLQGDSYYLINMGDDRDQYAPALSWYMPQSIRDDLSERLTDCNRQSGRVLSSFIGRLGGAEFCKGAQIVNQTAKEDC